MRVAYQSPMEQPEHRRPWLAASDPGGSRRYRPDFPSGGGYHLREYEGHLRFDIGDDATPGGLSRACAFAPEWLDDLAESLTSWLAGGYHHGEFHDRVWLRRAPYAREQWPPNGYGQTYNGPTLATLFAQGPKGPFRIHARHTWMGRGGDECVLYRPEARLLLADALVIADRLTGGCTLTEAIADLPDLDSRTLDPNPPRRRPNDFGLLLSGERVLCAPPVD